MRGPCPEIAAWLACRTLLEGTRDPSGTLVREERHTNPMSTTDRPQINPSSSRLDPDVHPQQPPESTLDRPPTSANRPRVGPRSGPNCPRVGLESAHIGPHPPMIDHRTSGARSRLSRSSVQLAPGAPKARRACARCASARHVCAQARLSACARAAGRESAWALESACAPRGRRREARISALRLAGTRAGPACSSCPRRSADCLGDPWWSGTCSPGAHFQGNCTQPAILRRRRVQDLRWGWIGTFAPRDGAG